MNKNSVINPKSKMPQSRLVSRLIPTHPSIHPSIICSKNSSWRHVVEHKRAICGFAHKPSHLRFPSQTQKRSEEINQILSIAPARLCVLDIHHPQKSKKKKFIIKPSLSCLLLTTCPSNRHLLHLPSCYSDHLNWWLVRHDSEGPERPSWGLEALVIFSACHQIESWYRW